MNGNAMGRSVVEACLVDVYRENRKEWRKQISKGLSKDSFLNDVVEDELNREMNGEPSTTQTKPKRKRKRKKGGRNDTDEPLQKKALPLDVNAIVAAMTVATSTNG